MPRQQTTTSRRFARPIRIATLLIGALMTLPAQGQSGVRSTPLETTHEQRKAITKAFLSLPTRAQIEVLDAALAAIEAIESPWLGSMRRLADPSRSVRTTAPDKFRFKTVGGRHKLRSRWSKDLPFPLRVDYDFATGVPVSVDADGVHQTKPKALRGKALATERARQLESMLTGNPPELDRSLAEILSQLDQQGPRRYAAFLVAWHHGKETFYDGLDRTAGTKESLFFYDAMQAEFLQQFVSKRHPDHDRIRASLDTTHDALHQAFLNYRQYRAARESIALALTLQPDSPLPAFLSRYADRPSDGYSTRDMVNMLLELAHGDVEKLLQELNDVMPSLPLDSLWTHPHKPIDAIGALYRQRIPAMIERAGDTSIFRDTGERHRLEVRARIAEAVTLVCRERGLLDDSD